MGGMIDTLKNAFKIPDLRKKLLFTLGMLIIYRVGVAVPVPGISAAAFTDLINRMGQLGSFLDIISGGAFKQVSIFAMGITPYINASIIMQLLTVAIPALERLQKEGDAGRKKIQRYVRYLTVGLALVQATAYWVATRSASSSTLPYALNAILVIVSFTAGTAFIMWIGEQINEYGIGNGISLIIFAGIVARGPSAVQLLFAYFRNWSVTRNIFVSLIVTLLVIVVFVLIIALVVFVQQAERRIPVQYAKKVVGRKMYGGQSTYLPIKVNQAGVIPVIFAMSIVSLPSTLISFFGSNGPIAQWFMNFSGNPFYYLFYALLIFGFTFFYSMIQFNPLEIANNLQKNGGFIPGIRPGRPTSDFINATSRRLSWFDALFLVLIVLFPILMSAVTGMQGIWFGGTAVLILVGVAIDLVNQMESQMVMRHYKGFLD
ncbi:MAG: preprotein translocase subunit SecY [Eubacteriales bacterium]|nr:preprotein translocase subunit SecY [Eubacteriales bacterium]MDD3197655.1 preprotein translocase subunit SecY [Eubacteriales bacterium]MDD4682861.1 preprotein translocase subunit SecY [Eubacteriales bacterium]